MHDTYRCFLLRWCEFSIVELYIRRVEGVDIDSIDFVGLGLMCKNKVFSWIGVTLKLRYFASLRIILSQEILDSFETFFAASSTLIHN